MRFLFAVIAFSVALTFIVLSGEENLDVGTKPLSFGELSEAERGLEIERLNAEFGPRLPTALRPYSFALQPQGVEQGVGVVDFELRADDLALPPLIITAGGSEGGFWVGGPSHLPSQTYVGDMLLSHGFSVRSLAYFGEVEMPETMGGGRLFPHLVERPLEPIAARIESARETRGALRRCIGFMGVSKGGELTLLLAAYGDDLTQSEGPLMDAAAAAVPSHVAWQAPYVTVRIRSSWAKDGEPVEFVRYPWLSRHMPAAFFDYPNVTALGEAALRNEAAVAAASIPVERAMMPVLMQGGRFDQMWPSSEMAEAAFARAEALNPDHQLAVENYDLNHFIWSEPEPVLGAVVFLSDALRAAQQRGDCEADFRPLAGAQSTSTP